MTEKMALWTAHHHKPEPDTGRRANSRRALDTSTPTTFLKVRFSNTNAITTAALLRPLPRRLALNLATKRAMIASAPRGPHCRYVAFLFDATAATTSCVCCFANVSKAALLGFPLVPPRRVRSIEVALRWSSSMRPV